MDGRPTAINAGRGFREDESGASVLPPSSGPGSMVLPLNPPDSPEQVLPVSTANADLQNFHAILQSGGSQEVPDVAPLKLDTGLDPTIPNIIIFGETGTGKSSVINMLDGRLIADVSSGASGCTFHSSPYEVKLKSSGNYITSKNRTVQFN